MIFNFGKSFKPYQHFFTSFLLPHSQTSSHLHSPQFFLLLRSPDRREHWKLLSSLKTTVEGLVSTNNPNVWSRYGGLQRLHKDMNNILSHGLKNEQVRPQKIRLIPLSLLCLFIYFDFDLEICMVA